MSADLLTVRLEQVPVDLWARSVEHSDALQREFTLMSSADADGAHVPRRLLDLVAALRAQYSAVTTAQEELLHAASEAGQPVLDEIVYEVPTGVEQAARSLGAMYDEADEHCREGKHLLTLATPPELVAFRRWFLDEFVAQAEGRSPTPWPAYRDVHPDA